MKTNPKDEGVIREIGNALVMTHNYEKAIEYYKNALRNNPDRVEMKLDLGKLCIKIGRIAE